jgi:hypothetical protein
LVGEVRSTLPGRLTWNAPADKHAVAGSQLDPAQLPSHVARQRARKWLAAGPVAASRIHSESRLGAARAARAARDSQRAEAAPRTQVVPCRSR